MIGQTKNCYENKIKLLQFLQNINNIKLICFLMSRCQPEVICSSTLEHIIAQGSKLAKDNQTIRKHLFNYTNCNNLCITNELVQQSGAKKQCIQQQKKEQELPQNLKKDQRCNNSIALSPSKKDSGRSSKFGINNRDTANTRSPRISRRSSAQTNRQIFSRNRSERVEANKFIDLTDIMNPPDGRIVTQAMKNENKRIEELRQKRQSQEKAKKLQQKANDVKQKAEIQRIESLKNKLNKHLRQKNNNFSFDLDGNYILFDNQRQHVSLRKKYPPANLKFDIEVQQDPNVQKYSHVHIKQKAARGQAFASAVLKTMNMSKFSLNLTSKTCNIDQFAFMKRNDLFNNNHSRQVTTIPYLQISQGTNYTETNTNLSIGKKSQRTTHSENKSKFKTHQFQHLKENTDKHNNKTQAMNFDIDLQKLEVQKRRIQSSRPYIRPKTSYVPKTAKTSDRITSVNQQLFCELIE